MNETQANLVFCKTHLDDSIRVINRVKRVPVVGLPSIEVRRILSMSLISSNLRQKLAATHHFKLLNDCKLCRDTSYKEKNSQVGGVLANSSEANQVCSEAEKRGDSNL